MLPQTQNDRQVSSCEIDYGLTQVHCCIENFEWLHKMASGCGAYAGRVPKTPTFFDNLIRGVDMVGQGRLYRQFGNIGLGLQAASKGIV